MPAIIIFLFFLSICRLRKAIRIAVALPALPLNKLDSAYIYISPCYIVLLIIKLVIDLTVTPGAIIDQEV